MNVTRVVLDLETLGTAPGCAILSIGAVKVAGEKPAETFYRIVNLASCLEAGLSVDHGTLLWWLKQGAAAREEVAGAARGVPLQRALWDFSLFVCAPDAEVWGNGADFDNAILDAAYRRCGMERPWGVHGSRCYRTLKNLFPDVKAEAEEGGTAHNALDDAAREARHLVALLARAREGGRDER